MITKQVIHKIDQFKSDKELLAIAGILFNLLSQLVEEHHYQETAPFIAASEHLPFLPDLYFPQTGISLLKYIISYHFNKKPADLAKAEMIAQTYQITGLEDFCIIIKLHEISIEFKFESIKIRNTKNFIF